MFSEFFADLRRRRVFHTAVIYAAAAWGVTEASTTVFEVLNFPAWVPMLVVILFLVGFPIAVYLSWVFDITTDGIRRTQPLGIRGWGAVTVSVVMLIGGTGVLFWLIYEPAVPTQADQSAQSSEIELQANSIAVLPFASAGGYDDSRYFAEGVAETLLAQMSKVENLVVRAKDSSFSLRDPAMDATIKARRLNVAFLLDGSVQRAGDRLRIIVRLVDGASGQYLWSETLDGTVDDVFDMQDRIAESVVAQLEPISSIVRGKPIQRRTTDNPAAYDHYLRGRYALNDGSPEALDRAVVAFDRAVELDEDFALAYIGRATARALRKGMLGFGLFNRPMPNQDPIQNDWFDYVYPARTRELGPELEQLVGLDIQEALKLAPELAEAQAAHGLLMLRMRHFDQAEMALKDALEINPSDAFAHSMLGLLYWEINLYDLAAEHLEIALALDPLSVPVRVYLANVLMYTKDRERAIDLFESIRAMVPEQTAWLMVRYPHFHAGQYVDLVKLYIEVMVDFRKGERIEPNWAGTLPFVVEWNYIYLGDISGAQRIAEAQYVPGSTALFVNGRMVLTEQQRAELGPIKSYEQEEYRAFFRWPWVIHDESFQDAYDHLTEILATVPDAVPTSPLALTLAARYALVLGKCQAAREYFELAGTELAPLDWPYSNIFMDSLFAHVDAIDYAIALLCVGEEEQARDLIDGTVDWLDSMEANGYGVSQIPVVRAKAYVLRGEKDRALDLLEQYAALPGPVLNGIKNDPAFKSLESDPRFQSVVATIREKNRVIVEQIDRAIEASGLEF